ncbi:MAG: DUF692 domain-containing protein [Alphaproteobacteria bacterium]
MRAMTDLVPSPDGAPPPAGIGFRAPHEAEILAAPPSVGFFEVHAENYMGGGASARVLARLRRERPISLHGVGLSLGSAEGLDSAHLARLAQLVERTEPFLVSEHLSWSVAGGVYLNDLLPLPYTEEALAIVADNIAAAQDWLRRPILVENPSAYLRFAASTIPEAEFLSALARRTGCGILCDVNNIHVSLTNLGGDAHSYLAALPAEAVGEIHLAGHAVADADGASILIDDHGSAVSAEVWALYEAAVRRFPHAPALVEWDSNLPRLSVLLAEAAQADARALNALARPQFAGRPLSGRPVLDMGVPSNLPPAHFPPALRAARTEGLGHEAA